MRQFKQMYSSYRKNAEALAEAVQRQHIANRATQLWQSLLERSDDKYIQRFFEGQLELSKLRALHHNLVAQSIQRAGREQIHPAINASSDRSALPVNGTSLSQGKQGNDKLLNQWEAHDAKAASLALLGESCRRLNLETKGHDYEDRARLEGATARSLKNLLDAKGNGRHVPEGQAVSLEERATLQAGLSRLERARRDLDDYNRAYARALDHLRAQREFGRTIRQMETYSAEHSPATRALFEEVVRQRDAAVGLAEKEALAAVSSYKCFQSEIELAREEYDALSLEFAPSSQEFTKPTQSRHVLEPADRTVAVAAAKSDLRDAEPMEELAPNETGPERDRTNSNQPPAPSQPMRNIATGVVIGEVLRELDHGM